MSDDSDITVTLTQRELRVLEFATWRFMNNGYDAMKYYALNNPTISDDQAKTMYNKFHKDTIDAEALVGKLRALMPQQEAL